MSPIKRLGMGLDALLGNTEAEIHRAEPSNVVETVLLQPNPFQPRREFNEEDLKSLADSIRKQGLLQPIVVRPSGEVYQIVAGERRWRAAKLLGLEKIQVVVRDIDDRKMLELALVENIQRKDLNPIEKARAFKQLMQLNNWTQEEMADAVGLGRPTVANFVRLLDLPPEVQEAVSRGTISMGHARALLAASQRGIMLQLLKRAIQEDLSVRALEKLLTQRHAPKPSIKPKQPYLEELEQKLMDRVGVRVEIMPEAIVIPYGSQEQLTAILKRLGVL